MTRPVYDSYPHAYGTDRSPQTKGRILIAPGSAESTNTRDLTLSEVLSIVKDEGISLLSEVTFVGGHVKWKRPETADEASARAERNSERDKSSREARYNAYLRLKEEFGGEQ